MISMIVLAGGASHGVSLSAVYASLFGGSSSGFAPMVTLALL